MSDGSHLDGQIGSHDVDLIAEGKESAVALERDASKEEGGKARVHIIRQILPRSANSVDSSLTTELTVRSDLLGYPGYLRREVVETFHHVVDGVLRNGKGRQRSAFVDVGERKGRDEP